VNVSKIMRHKCR